MAKVAEGIRYAERVVAREIVACEYVRLACQRFLDDLAHGEERGIFSARRARSTSSIFINLCLTLRGHWQASR
jgi:phage terminase large subunit-like protein